MKKKRAHVLLVEDSEPDQIIVKRAFEDGKIACDIYVSTNGKLALKYLEDCNSEKGRGYPDLILMDINMPVMDGKQALERIRSDPELRHIPVIMLTTSSRDKDVLDSYQRGVNAYLTKPVNPSDFIAVVQQLEHFWFELITLPPQPDNFV